MPVWALPMLTLIAADLQGLSLLRAGTKIAWEEQGTGSNPG